MPCLCRFFSDKFMNVPPLYSSLLNRLGNSCTAILNLLVRKIGKKKLGVNNSALRIHSSNHTQCMCLIKSHASQNYWATHGEAHEIRKQRNIGNCHVREISAFYPLLSLGSPTCSSFYIPLSACNHDWLRLSFHSQPSPSPVNLTFLL